MSQVTKLLHVNPDLARKLKSSAAALGITLQEATNEAIKKYLKEVEENGTICKSSTSTIRT
jgi:hypothetical protein